MQDAGAPNVDEDPDDFMNNINSNIDDYQLSMKDGTLTVTVRSIYRKDKSHLLESGSGFKAADD